MVGIEGNNFLLWYIMVGVDCVFGVTINANLGLDTRIRRVLLRIHFKVNAPVIYFIVKVWRFALSLDASKL